MKTLSFFITQRDIKELNDAEEVFEALRAERRLQEQDKERLTQLLTQQTMLQNLQAQYASEEHHSQEQEVAFRQLQSEWKQFLEEFELPDNLHPEDVLELMAHRDHAFSSYNAWYESSQLVTQEQSESQQFLHQLNMLLQQIGRHEQTITEPTMVMEMVHEIGQALRHQLQVQQTQVHGQTVLQEKKKEQIQLEEAATSIGHQMARLLETAEASDEKDFQERAARYKEQVHREQEIARLTSLCTVHTDSQEKATILREELSNFSLSELYEQRSKLHEEQLCPTQEHITLSLQAKGRVQQQLDALEHNAQLSESLLEHETLLTQLDRTVQQWAIHTTTRFLLEKARLVYERERQPAVLRYASEYFSTMTGGRYHRIKVPLGEARLEIEGESGYTQTTNHLSRGTAEQLYLAMRLAFIREYATHAGILPLVMDDIFVNFDPDRAKAAIEVLRDFSATHQILFFTCHPHVRQWFTEIIPDLPVRSLAHQEQATTLF